MGEGFKKSKGPFLVLGLLTEVFNISIVTSNQEFEFHNVGIIIQLHWMK